MQEACCILFDEETMAWGLRAHAPSTRVLSDAGGLMLQGR